MLEKKIIKKIVENELLCSAHNMDHVMRVYNYYIYLAKYYKGIDLEILKLAALLHDIAWEKEDQDNTGEIDHAVLGAEMATQILKSLGYPENKTEFIKHCILTHRFRGVNEPKTLEAKILFDADKLDIIGAVGIARSYMIAGQYSEKIYSDTSISDYIQNNLVGGKLNGRIKDLTKTAPNIEFETKFKHIPDKLYTKRARKMAKKKIRFMKDFFRKLKGECKELMLLE